MWETGQLKKCIINTESTPILNSGDTPIVIDNKIAK